MEKERKESQKEIKKKNGSGANRVVRADKKETKKKEMRGGGKERGKEKREGERKEKGVFHFSLRSTEIGPSVFVGTRGKAGLHNEGYARVPKFESFVKLQDVGNFPTLIIFSLKVI